MTSDVVVCPFFKVGPNAIEDSQVAYIYGNLAWVVHWYKTNGFEGAGQAVAKQSDGRYQVHDLIHDARFGPTEFWITDAKKNLTGKDVFMSSSFDLVFEGDFEGLEEECRLAIEEKISELESRETHE